jgi:hypothetical protein
MGLFSRSKPRGVNLPADFARTLALYGRWSFDPTTSGIDPSQIGHGNIEYELFMLAQPDNAAFIEALAATAIPAGGWAVYGGARAVWNAVGTEVHHADYLTMLDTSIAFIQAEYGISHLSPYELRRLEQTKSHLQA